MKTALGRVKGIAAVYGSDELASRTATEDPILRACRMSYMAGRTGDFVVIPKPYWLIRSIATGTTHGTPYGYDARVPVVLMGAGIKPGRYFVPASPLDIAPTLAALAGITLSRADGHVLADAIRR
jgi:predicted AlkP superfamily pyrophosphatase or phosphodiesterase